MILVTIIRIRSRSIIVNVIRTEYGSHQLQQELIDRTESRQNYDDLVEEILLLREQQEQTNMDEAAKAEHRDRIQALCNFINSQPRTITKFDGTLVRKLLKDVKVCDVFIEFRFKSGTSVIIEKWTDRAIPVSLSDTGRFLVDEIILEDR